LLITAARAFVCVAALALSVGVVRASVLSETASSLSPGDSIKLDTQLLGTILSPDNADFLMWSSSGVWDPVRRQVRFIGKRDGSYPYRFLVYNETNNSWSNSQSLHANLAGPNLGHGYDHNAVDPATGRHFFRPFNSNVIYVWDGSWSSIDLPGSSSSVAASLSWIPGRGLVYAGASIFAYWNGSSWTDLGDTGLSAYHMASEYNHVGQTLIFGGGNGGNQMWKLGADLSVSQISTPPFNVGVGSSQGVLAADPSSDQFVAWQKDSKNWVQYDVSDNVWAPLSLSAGSGDAKQRGAPNLIDSGYGHATIAIPINTYGVIMFIQYRGQISNADVWLYKHSDSVALPVPGSPKDLAAR
jgi:hypothetical protein